jgi:hypothetical protein
VIRVRTVEGGVEIDVPNDHPRSALAIESGTGRLVRLALDGTTLVWARDTPWTRTLAWARMGSPTLAIVPPIRGADARSTAIDAWPRAFASWIVSSSRVWLRPGTWSLGMTSNVELETRGAFIASARMYRRAMVLPLRERSPETSGRVKSWRRHARDGTLPPILLGWLSTIDAYVVLDGHDRLRAAELESITPDWLALSAMRETKADWTDDVRERAQRAAIDRYELAHRAEARLSDRSRDELNRSLVGAFDDWRQRSHATPARFRPDLSTLLARERHVIPTEVAAALSA